MNCIDEKKKFTIVCGHYGCGKTNFSLNLALSKANAGKKVILVDLDLVNPYFLSSDYRSSLEKHGIRVIAPLYAGTNVETPALPADLFSVFTTEDEVIIDLGGDDAGAVVLGRYHTQLQEIDYEMLYVINRYRNLIATPEEAIAVAREIEAASRCHITKVVNNSHLKEETTFDTIRDTIAYAEQTAAGLKLPLWGHTIPTYLCKDDRVRADDGTWFPVEIYVKTVWDAT